MEGVAKFTHTNTPDSMVVIFLRLDGSGGKETRKERERIDRYRYREREREARLRTAVHQQHTDGTIKNIHTHTHRQWERG